MGPPTRAGHGTRTWRPSSGRTSSTTALAVLCGVTRMDT